MNEDRLRAFLGTQLGLAPEEITDETSSETNTKWDSLVVLNLTFFLEEDGPQLSEEQIVALRSWPAVKAAALRPFYKALVLDADGVLWAGVIGEGRIVPFPNVQETYLDLQRRGVILCLATRNNRADVDTAFAFEGMVLRQEHFAVMECGWGSKVESLQRIAETLNIGLDSIVFVDDSEFECESVRQQLPEVRVVRAPAKIALGVARDVAALFPKLVDTAKTEQYHALAQARKERPKFATEAEFLASLGIKVRLHHNRRGEAARIAELTQKANQFNLTTRRYTMREVRELMASGDVYSLHYRDRFGDQGLTGVIIVQDGKIDTFLLSCRILGRGVEYAPWEFLDLGEVRAEYIPTPKNEQVAGLWDWLGLLREDDHYVGRVNVSCPSYIEVTVK